MLFLKISTHFLKGILRKGFLAQKTSTFGKFSETFYAET